MASQDDLIRQRAYAIWESEGFPDGCAERHWRQAEQECGTPAPDDPGNGATEPAPVAACVSAFEGSASYGAVNPTHADDRRRASVDADEAKRLANLRASHGSHRTAGCPDEAAAP